MDPELTIAWVPATSSTVTRLRSIAPARSSVVPFQDDGALLDAISRGTVTLTVVEAGGATHELAVLVLRRLHDAFPDHPVVAWCDLKTIRSQELLDVARAGVQDIVRHEFDELRHVFARIMATATQRAVGVRIAELLRPDVPTTLRPFLLYALEHADQHLDLDAVASVFGVSRRTLHARLIESGLPATRTFLTWCRILVASALLDQPGHTLDSVAGQLDFNDGHHLGNILRRYAGYGIIRLRDSGAIESTVAAFRSSLAQGLLADAAPDSLPEPSSAD